MNNTKSILLVAIITATLVLGTSVNPMQSFADRDNNDDHNKTKDYKSSDRNNNDDHKKPNDYKSSLSEKTQIDKKSANQHQDQDNTCYRGDDCQQANQGQQVIGEDNDAKGFNDQSDNLSASVVNGSSSNSSATS